MYRRQVLATGALTLALPVTGCLGGGDDPTDTEGDDDDPIDADPESLLLTLGHVESVMDGRPIGDGWSLDSFFDNGETTMYRDSTVAQTIVPFDGEELRFEDGRILNGVWVHDSVEAARDTYETHPDYGEFFEEDGDIQVSIAVQSMARVKQEWLFVLFRDANVVGAVSYRNPELDEDEVADIAVDLAVEMHDDWRD